jgi:hypothetical protein
MAYADLAKAWTRQDSVLLNQVAGACLSCAFDIVNEDAGTQNHSNRIAWTERVKRNPIQEAMNMVVHVCENATIAAALPTPTDSDVKFVVASYIDTYATGA